MPVRARSRVSRPDRGRLVRMSAPNDPRRTQRGGPGANTRPGSRSQRGREGRVSESGPDSTSLAAIPETVRPPGGRRFTGRAAVLVLVLAVLTVSYASSLRAYLQQRSHIGDLHAQILEREASINDLEREKSRWDDPAYVKSQARARFGYLMPGETGFEVIGVDGKPLAAESSLNDPDEVIKVEPTAWWVKAWDSMELAGHPPKPAKAPAGLVDGTTKQR